MDEAPIIQLKNCDHLIRFCTSIKEILEDSILLYLKGFPYDTKEFFELLLLFVRYFNQYLPREIPWEDLKERHGVLLSPLCDWRQNNNMASILLDKSLTVLENRTSCQDFFTQNKARIKRLCYKYEKMTSVAIILGLIKKKL